MILRDPVHGLIAFEGSAEKVVQGLLATREVQRLRRVRHLGLASLVFPGGEHSRFAHAIGAAHVMLRLQDRLRACQHVLPADERLDEEAAADALAGALLHDLGHGPFSHLFEEVLPHAKHHETWTRHIIENPDTEVHQCLESISAGMADRVANLLAGDYRLPYLSRSVSGTLDVDRADYLLRDSHMTGVRYGLYDLDWVLRAFTFGQVANKWVLAIEGRKGLPPIESFFLGRHFMYQQVYHHKATRAAEALIRGIFVRLRELITDGSAPTPLPSALRSAALGDGLSIDDYLQLDDATLMASIAAWERGPDQALATLCRDLRDRRLPKTAPLPPGQPKLWEEARARAAAVVQHDGGRPDLEVWIDIAEDTPYSEPTDASAHGLWVVLHHQPVQRLGQASFLLGELRNKHIERPRIIFPARLRQQVLDAIHGIIGSDPDFA